MANSKNAAKRAKTSEKSRLRNTKTKAELKTLRKNLLAAVEEAAAPKTDAAYRTFCAALDKGVKHGILRKNTAIRKKSRAGALLRKTAAK